MTRRLFEYHPVIGYRFIPNLKARVTHEAGGYLIRTNSQGFRCRHEFDQPLSDKKRVLLFGDSFTAGDGVSNPKRYGDLMEERLNLEVFNFGMSGSGTDQQLIISHEFAADLDASMTVIAVLVENIRRCAARFRTYHDQDGREMCYAKPYYEIEQGELKLRGVPVEREPIPSKELAGDQRQQVDRGGRFAGLRKFVNKAGLKEVVQKMTGYQPLPEYDDPENEHWLLLKVILKQFAATMPQPVLVVPLPLYQYVEETSDPTSYQARFREFADESGVEVHDPLPDLWKYSQEERRFFRFKKDVHPTPAGHRALSESIGNAIQRRLQPAV